MTIYTLLKESGLSFSRHDAGKLGMLIMKKATQDKVKWTKKEELVEVNDFPEDFIPEMQQIISQYFTTKAQKNDYR